MAFKLDDLINKTKKTNHILDLSKTKIKSKEEFEKYFDKIPEYKIRPEKLRIEDIRVRDTDFSFTFNKKEAKSIAKHEFIYGDPVPVSMKSVRLEDLAAVDINWRMLTMARPKNRLEEDIFSRLVELGKLRLSTAQQEAKNLASATGGLPGSQVNALLASMGIIVSKNKRGVTETRMKTCKECGEELCTGAWCKEFPYDSYTRMIMDKDELEKQEEEAGGGGQSRRGSKRPENNQKGKKNGATKGKITGAKVKLRKVKRKKKKKKKGKQTSGSDEDEE